MSHQPPLGPPQRSDCPVPSRVQSEVTLQGLCVRRATPDGIRNNPNGSQGWPGAGNTAGTRTRTRGICGIWSPATFRRWDCVSSFLHAKGQRRTGVSLSHKAGRKGGRKLDPGQTDSQTPVPDPREETKGRRGGCSEQSCHAEVPSRLTGLGVGRGRGALLTPSQELAPQCCPAGCSSKAVSARGS